MKNYGDLGGCYPPRPTASTDNSQAFSQKHNSEKNLNIKAITHLFVLEDVVAFDLGCLTASVFTCLASRSTIPLFPWGFPTVSLFSMFFAYTRAFASVFSPI